MPPDAGQAGLPSDHAVRMSRSMLALEGLSVGDAFGEGFFGFGANVEFAVPKRWLPPEPWAFTDDTMMALSIVDVLSEQGRVDQDILARLFAARYTAEPDRGYGMTAHEILADVHLGTDWRVASRRAFKGQGSMGNGSAMRVGPLGAYFADDLGRVCQEAAASAEVTHAHHEGIAGAVAVAIATATAWCTRETERADAAGKMFQAVLDHTPQSRVHEGVARASSVPLAEPVGMAASLLGNGSEVTCPDTVPLCLWCAARHFGSYEEAMWSTVSALGDADTNCAIVGSIVVMTTGLAAIPSRWLAAREPLKR